jgi:RNA polymerase sigma-70 factor (sigma-E family)
MALGSAAEAEFVAFVAARRAHLVYMATALLGPDRDDAEDIVQAALIKLASHWSAARDPNAYVRKALVNLTVDRGRRRRWSFPVGGSDDLDLRAQPGPDEARRADDTVTLRGALLALPLRQRQVLTLRYLEGCGESETAALLGCTVGTVKNTSHKGLRNLRALIGDNHSGASGAAQTGSRG